MALPVFLPDSGEQLFAFAAGSAWDICFLASQQVPGLVKVTVSTSRKIDVANAPGLDSAQLRFQGLDPGEVEIECLVWTPEQQADLELLLETVAPKKSKKPPQPFVISHPATDAAKITAVVVEKVGWYKDGSIPQSKAITLSCKQWLKPKKALAGVPTLNAPTVAPTESGTTPAGPPGPPSGSAAGKGP